MFNMPEIELKMEENEADEADEVGDEEAKLLRTGQAEAPKMDSRASMEEGQHSRSKRRAMHSAMLRNAFHHPQRAR